MGDFWFLRFRGRNPPASLKRLCLPRPGGPWHSGFRGRNPPASLKPWASGTGGLLAIVVSGGEILRPH